MLILGLESSAVAASAAVWEDGKIISEVYANNGLTHSVTLLPQIKAALDFSGKRAEDIDLFAISNGPGSFTGLRIGAATIKGICAENQKTLGVSTLEAMGYDHSDFEGIICPCMDARCSQLYNALFFFENGALKRLCEDRTILIPELTEEIKRMDKKVLLVGDGALLFYNKIKENDEELLDRVQLCAEHKRFQHASGVCKCAEAQIENGKEPCSPENLILSYLRLPQAERELKKKETQK